jgi:hypothetical protein
LTPDRIAAALPIKWAGQTLNLFSSNVLNLAEDVLKMVNTVTRNGM